MKHMKVHYFDEEVEGESLPTMLPGDAVPYHKKNVSLVYYDGMGIYGCI